MALTIGQDSTKIGTSGYFYYNPKNHDANAVLNQAYEQAAETATEDNPVTICVESGQYWINDHVYPKSHVYLQGEDGIVFKLAPGLKCACMYGKEHMYDTGEPYAHWGYHGANDGIGCYHSHDIEVCYCRFDMVGHDGVQVASGCRRVKIHHSFCRIRTNVTFRISYKSEDCEIFCNEVTKGDGGGSAVEFVQACPGTLVSRQSSSVG